MAIYNPVAVAGQQSNTFTQDCVYQFSGDENGILFFIGTNYNEDFWINPHTAGKVKNSLSYPYSEFHNQPELLSNRAGSNINLATPDAANSFLILDLGKKKKLQCNHYTLRGRNYDSNHLRSWELTGSNDAQSWSILDTQTNNQTIGLNTWFNQAIISNTAYRYLKVTQTGLSSTGDNILTLGQWEFYGKLTYA